MRDCGYFDTDECVSGQNFEDGTAVGTICHCKENRCNGAANAMSSVFFLVATAMIVVVKQLMYRPPISFAAGNPRRPAAISTGKRNP